MRAVIQRVIRASVSVEGQVISSIGRGLLILVGIERNDSPTDAAMLLKKILSAKLFDDPGDAWGGWKRSVKDAEGEILCVSQFTLHADLSKGAKPDFHNAMPSSQSRDFYFKFLDDLRGAYVPDRIKDGQFGGIMEVSLVNDGPLTILLDSRSGKAKSRDTTPSASGAATPLTPSNGLTTAAAGAEPLTGMDKWKAKMQAKQDKLAGASGGSSLGGSSGAVEEGKEGTGGKGKKKGKGDRHPRAMGGGTGGVVDGARPEGADSADVTAEGGGPQSSETTGAATLRGREGEAVSSSSDAAVGANGLLTDSLEDLKI